MDALKIRRGQVVEELRDLPAAEREALLRERCAGRPELRDEIRSLLAHADNAEGFFRLLAPGPSRVPRGRPTAAPADPGLDAGARVGRYRIVELIGAGGVGTVYRARDEDLDRNVAWKMVPTPDPADAERSRRFLAEARAAASLVHPNVYVIHEIGEVEPGWSFLAMAYYKGETLRERIRRGALSADEAVQVGLGLAEGLLAVHELGIVHRDVKPENVLVTEEGRVKLLDFGLAKKVDVSLTLPGLTPGTLAYMSPEQVRGEEVGPASDVWSTGVVLHEMLTGAHPFAGWHGLEVVRAIGDPDLHPSPEFGSGVPKALARVVERLLGEDPSPPAAAPGPDVLAVMPFRVGGAEPSLDYLGEGMVDLLCVKLDNQERLRPLDSHTLIGAWRQAGANGRAPSSGAMALAWRHRQRLAPFDRTYVEAVVGPRYPDASTSGEILSAREALVAHRPDSPEAWFRFGEWFSSALVWIGVPETLALRRTGEAFERSLELDSAFAPALLQLGLNLEFLGERARADSLYRRYLEDVPGGMSAEALRCRRSLLSEGVDAVPGLLPGPDDAAKGAIGRCLGLIHWLYPAHAPARDSLMAALARRMDDPTVLLRMGPLLYEMSPDRGRPREAARYGEALYDAGQWSRREYLARQIRAALWWDGLQEPARQAVLELRDWLDAASFVPLEHAAVEAACALGEWGMARGDLRTADRIVRRLRTAAGEARSAVAVGARQCAELLDIGSAVEGESPHRLSGADSLLTRGLLHGHVVRETEHVLSRLL